MAYLIYKIIEVLKTIKNGQQIYEEIQDDLQLGIQHRIGSTGEVSDQVMQMGLLLWK